MPTFIDESGDTGRVGDGGTRFFRLAALWVPTLEDAELFQEAVRQLRREHGLATTYEFKFAKTHRKPYLRGAFLSKALCQEFRFAVSALDKTEDYWASAGRHEFHWACATELAALLRPVYLRAEAEKEAVPKDPIVVDDNADADFLATVKRQFRGVQSKVSPGSPLVGKVVFRDSASNVMLQLVDMVCGTVGALIDNEDTGLYDLIAERDVEMRAR